MNFRPGEPNFLMKLGNFAQKINNFFSMQDNLCVLSIILVDVASKKAKLPSNYNIGALSVFRPYF